MSAPYNLSDSTLEIAQRFHKVLDIEKGALGLQDVWFGDQESAPRTPCVCVEPGVKRRNLAGVPDMTMLLVDTYFLIYHTKIDETQKARADCIEFAERIENFLHVNHMRLLSEDGTRQLTIHGFCTDFDPGYAYKSGTLYHAVQMTWTSTTKTSLQRLSF